MWFKDRRGKDRPLTQVGARLVAETEAFLSGTFAREMRVRGDVVPGWARLNLFAHVELAVIEGLHGSNGLTAESEAEGEDSWWSAQRALAAELVGLVDGDADLLGRIQQKVLVPLELRLIQIEAEQGLTAGDLVQATRAALRSNIP